jgi:hypothetical protein
MPGPRRAWCQRVRPEAVHPIALARWGPRAGLMTGSAKLIIFPRTRSPRRWVALHSTILTLTVVLLTKFNLTAKLFQRDGAAVFSSEVKGMKTKLLVFIATVAMLGAWPAKAATFTYKVSFCIGAYHVTGSITTRTNKGYLTHGVLRSWSLRGSDGTIIKSSTIGASETDTYDASVPRMTPLTLSPTAIVFVPTTSGGGNLEFCGNAACTPSLFFGMGATPIIDWGPTTSGGYASTYAIAGSNTLQIATRATGLRLPPFSFGNGCPQ